MKPPRLELSTDLQWLLRRAFGPPGQATPRPGSAVGAVRLAHTLDLAARVAARQAHEQLVEELGHDQAMKLQLYRLRVVALNQVLARTTNVVFECAQQQGIALVLLKHTALRASGIVGPGARDARDVDVLVDRDAARSLHRELQKMGFRPAAEGYAALHLPPLHRDAGEVIELHHGLWGLLVPGAGGPRLASELIEAGYAKAGHEGHIPVPELLSAHALVHALVQHRTAPTDYPTMRVLGDLSDIGIDSLDLAKCTEIASPSLTAPSIATALSLVRLLRDKEPAHLTGEARAFELLSHLVAGSLDEDYQQASFLNARHALSAIKARFERRLLSTEDSANVPTQPESDLPRLARRFALACLGYARLRLRREPRLKI